MGNLDSSVVIGSNSQQMSSLAQAVTVAKIDTIAEFFYFLCSVGALMVDGDLF